jgi:DNA repair exonuclease SbcCD ATPase subunit
MEKSIPQPILNERHETRLNFLKKDKYQLFRRLEDIEERLYSTKNTIQTLLASSNTQLMEKDKSAILDFLIEEKNYLSKSISETEAENKEANAKSVEQKKKIEEIMTREKNIETDFAAKLEAVLKESKDKEENIRKLSVKCEQLKEEFKILAKNRLNASINPKDIPELLEKKQNAIKRVISKVHEYSKYLDAENAELEKKIDKEYQMLCRLNMHAHVPFKIVKPLDDFMRPIVQNLVQADIRSKVENLPQNIPNLSTIHIIPNKNHKILNKLEEKLIKIDSLCRELKTAETVNLALKEDKNYLLSTLAHVNPRKTVKTATIKNNFASSYYKTHKRVLSNPLDYCSREFPEMLIPTQASRNDLELNLSKELNDFSSVEENFYEAPGDSIIDDILDI